MTKALDKAIDELRALPEPEQDVLAEFLEGIIAERKFDRLLESPESLELLNRMADAALEDHRRGETRDIEDLCR